MNNGSKQGIVIASILILGGGIFFLHYQNQLRSIISPTKSQAVAGSQLMIPTIPTTSTYEPNEALNHLELNQANIIWYTNYNRIQSGIKPLATSQALNRSARAKNRDMLAYNYFAHIRPGGFSFDRFIDAEQYPFIKIGENLAMGDFSTSKEVVDAWMKSPEHKRNILDTNYTEMGASIETGMINGKQTVLITQHFGNPRKNCPTINQTTKSGINTLRKQLGDMSADIKHKQDVLGKTGYVEEATYNELMNEYTRLVAVYNSTLTTMNTLVKTYNDQVLAFDKCVKGN